MRGELISGGGGKIRSRQVSLGVKELVYDELLRIAEAACPAELARFPALQRRLATAVLEFIQVCLVCGVLFFEFFWGGVVLPAHIPPQT